MTTSWRRGACDRLQMQRLLICGLACANVYGYRFAANLKPGADPRVINLFSNETAALVGEVQLEKAFNSTYKYFEKQFDTKAACACVLPRAQRHACLTQAYQQFMREFGKGLQRYKQSDAYASYVLYPDRPACPRMKLSRRNLCYYRPHCDKGGLGPATLAANHVSGMAAFPASRFVPVRRGSRARRLPGWGHPETLRL